MATVTVCGSASATVRPDDVVIGFGLNHLAGDAAAALDEVAARTQRLTSVLAEHGLSPDDWVTNGVHVAAAYEWRNDANTLLGYRASSGVSATLRQLERVGALISAAVTRCDAEMQGLTWRVDPDNPARRALLGEAAIDARIRAEAYVTALGLRLGAVESISEFAPGGGGPAAPTAPVMRRSAKVFADAPPLEVSGGQAQLGADVYVTFSVLPA